MLAVCQQEDPGQGQDWIYVLMIHLPEKMEFIVFLLPVGDGMQKTGCIRSFYLPVPSRKLLWACNRTPVPESEGWEMPIAGTCRQSAACTAIN